MIDLALNVTSARDKKSWRQDIDVGRRENVIPIPVIGVMSCASRSPVAAWDPWGFVPGTQWLPTSECAQVFTPAFGICRCRTRGQWGQLYCESQHLWNSLKGVHFAAVTAEMWWSWFSQQVVSDSCGPMDCSPPWTHGLFQVRRLEWIAISFSRGSSWPWDWYRISCVSCMEGRSLPLRAQGSPQQKCSQILTWGASSLDASRGVKRDSLWPASLVSSLKRRLPELRFLTASLIYVTAALTAFIVTQISLKWCYLRGI